MNLLITLSALGILTMLGSVLKERSWILPLCVTGLLLASYFALAGWDMNAALFGMMRIDNYAVAFTIVNLIAALVFIFMYHETHVNVDEHLHEVFAIVLFSLVGVVVMVSFTSMLTLFLGIEILSLSLYIMAGLRKRDLLSNEAALKYFLMGAFSTGFLLFGIAMLYGATGSFMVSDIAYYLGIHSAPGPFIVAGIILLLVGLLFKVAAAPFHFWTPDVYQGAPTLVTGYMATVGKVAAFAALLRLFQLGFTPAIASYQSLLAVVAVITMFVGNLTALYQKSTKRMLAYSSIAHAGYMLIALMASNNFASGAVFFYAIAYSCASLIAFGVVAILQQSDLGDDITAFKGLGKKNPVLAITFAIAMISLAGIPPTAGFFAKFYIFSAAIKDGWVWIVALAVINSFISIYFYFRPVIASFMEKGNDTPVLAGRTTWLLLIILVFIILVAGIFPGLASGIL